MAELTRQLKTQHKLDAEAISTIESYFGETGLNVFKDFKKYSAKGKYSDSIRKFALTLFCYSNKAYSYICKLLPLPHPRTITKWLSTIDGNPGITKESIDSVKRKIEESEYPLLFTLMLDEMSIKKQIEWNGKENIGFVDLGTNEEDDSLPAATNALVFLLVPLNGNWKIPVAYYLTEGLTGKVLASLTRNLLTHLHKNTINVLALVCDGCGGNQSMLAELGVELKYPLKTSWFPHPADPSNNVYVFLDNCHMFKLVRNMLAQYETIQNGKTGKLICWEFIANLHKVQQDEGLRLANKLKRNHIEFASQKMKVNLSVQALSNSTAQALLCLKQLGHDDFQSCDETVAFIKLMDSLFDLMNSRNPFGKGYKAPLRIANKQTWLPFLTKAEDYLINLQTTKGKPLYKTKRKTAILGYLLMIRNMKAIFTKYVEQQKLLRYILTYKFSQDHVELFFSAVRSLNGRNNNPNFIQFKAAYRRILNIHDNSIVSGNCTAQDETKILSSADVITSDQQVQTEQISRKYDFTQSMNEAPDHDYCMFSQADCYSPYTGTIVTYISGFVAKKLLRTTVCKTCANALYTTTPPHHDRRFILIELKDKGGLTYPSSDVLKVTETTERVIRRYMSTTNGKPTNRQNVKQLILTGVLSHIVGLPVFDSIKGHMFETQITNNHIHTLCTSIVNAYMQIRFHHEAKTYTSEIMGTNIRNRLTKYITFNNQ